MSKFVTSIIGLVVMAMLASRQLFLFALTSERSSLSGGRSHLWLAAVASIAACVAGGLMFYFFRRYEESKPKVEMTSSRPPRALIAINPSNNLRPVAPFEAVRWALANPWLTEGQADDRMQMDGSVTDSGQTAPGQRAFARRTHQLRFKQWSQARHD